MNKNFTDFMQKYANNKIAVAVSGGVDSICLLHWLAAWKKQETRDKRQERDKGQGLNLVALHVNHGLRAAATAEAEYVESTAAALDVPCRVFHWTGAKPASGLESAARDARYKLMTDYCRAAGIDILVTAHQADDQIETFLMNLGRGSGVYGLAAMRAESMRGGMKIVRPLLNVPRRELAQYCHHHNIKYFSDEMNEDEKYTRVRIRKNRHLLNDKLGISDERILLAIQNLSRTRDALENHVSNLLSLVFKNGRAVFAASFLFDEPLDIRLKLLGTLIQQIGENDYPPRLNSLETALSCLGGDCKITLGHCTLRRHGDNILIVPQGASASFRKHK